MLRLSVILGTLAAALASSYQKPQHAPLVKHKIKTTPGIPVASLGVFYDKKCRAFPELLVQTPPGACTPFPGTTNFFQLLCGEQTTAYDKKDKKPAPKKPAPKDDSSKSTQDSSEDDSSASAVDTSDSAGSDGSYTVVDKSSSVSGASTDSSSSSASDSSSGSASDGSSSGSSSKKAPKKKVVRTKPTHVPVVLRLCKDKFCKKCKRVVVTTTNKCTRLPTKNWYAPAPQENHWRKLTTSHHQATPATPVWQSFVAKCPVAAAPKH